MCQGHWPVPTSHIRNPAADAPSSSDSDYIVALNAAQYGSGGYCNQGITITYNGKSVGATIVDMCPGCAYGSLDMSPALFKEFADESVGTFQMTWDFGSSNSGGDATTSSSSSTSQYVAPSTSSTTQETPTSTYVAPTTSDTPTSTSQSTTVAPTSTETSSSAPVSTDLTTSNSTLPAVTSTAGLNATNATITATANMTASTGVVIANATSTILPDTVTTDSSSDNSGLASLNNLVSLLGRIVVVGASL